MTHRHSECGGPLSFEGPCGGCTRCVPGLYDDERDRSEADDDTFDWDYVEDRRRDEGEAGQ